MFFDFFSQPSSLGICISDDALSIVQLGLHGELVAHSNILLEDGTVRFGKLLDKEKLVDKLREGFTTAHPKAIQVDSKRMQVVVGLPEAHVFLYASRLPADSDGTDFVLRASAEASAIVPFNPQDMSWFYKRFENKVLTAGVFQETIDSYADAFKTVGLSPVVFDIDSAALGRSLLDSLSLDSGSHDHSKSTMIVDIGSRSSLFVIFDAHHMVNLSVAALVGGSEMNMVAEEIKNARTYYNFQFDESVGEIILSGDLSYIPDAISFLSKETGLPVSHGDPFAHLKNIEVVADISQHLSYVRAVGFALRNVPVSLEPPEIDFGSV